METWAGLVIRPKPAGREGADLLSVICHLPFVICHSGEPQASRLTGVSHLSSHLYGFRVVPGLLFPAPASML